MEGQPQLPGADWHKGDFRRADRFTAGAKSFTEAQGTEYQHPDTFAAVRADPDVIMSLGKSVTEQEGTPRHLSPQLHESYKALHAGIEAQYEHLTKPVEHGGMGVSVEVTPHDPYPDPITMRNEVERTGKLQVLGTEATGESSGESVLSADVNDKFRAVHDAFGHLAAGRNFTAHGEEGAMRHHMQMFPPEAHAALASELRAQTAGVTYKREFPENRAYEMPDWAKQVSPELPRTPKRKPVGEQGELF